MEWNENLQLAQFTKQRESLHVDVTNAVPLEDPAKNNNNNKKKTFILVDRNKTTLSEEWNVQEIQKSALQCQW